MSRLMQADLLVIGGGPAGSAAAIAAGRRGLRAIVLEPTRYEEVVADEIVGEGWIAAGDAALAHDPLAGQGVVWVLQGGSMAGNAAAATVGGNELPINEYVSWVRQRARAAIATRIAYDAAAAHRFAVAQ